MANSSLVPEAKNGLSKFRTEVANEMGFLLQITMETYLLSNVEYWRKMVSECTTI